MSDPPAGDPRTIPNDLSDRLSGFDEALRHGLATLGATAKALGEWRGISYVDIYIATKQLAAPISDEEAYELQTCQYNPITWLMVTADRNEPMTLAFEQALYDNWITIVNGYVFPTQDLATLFCN